MRRFLVVLSVILCAVGRGYAWLGPPDGAVDRPAEAQIQTDGPSEQAASDRPDDAQPLVSMATMDGQVWTDTLLFSSEQTATIRTDRGDITLVLFDKIAPATVDSFVSLVHKGFYDGLTFHRVVPGFVVQGGCPLGDGRGGPGYQLKAEFGPLKHVTGTVAMARSKHPDSAGSQFYICLAPTPHLDGQYTIFGQVLQGLDVVQRILKGDVMRTVTMTPQPGQSADPAHDGPEDRQ